MATDNISSIIDPQVPKDIEIVIAKLIELENAVKRISDDAISIKVQMQGADNLLSLTDQLNSIQKAVNELNKVQAQSKDVTLQLATVTQSYGVDVVSASKALAELRRDLDAANEQFAKLAKLYEAGSISSASYVRQSAAVQLRINELKIGIKEYNDALNSHIRLENMSTEATQKNTAATIANKDAYNAAVAQIKAANSAVSESSAKMHVAAGTAQNAGAMFNVSATGISKLGEEANKSRTLLERFGDVFGRQLMRAVGSLIIWQVAVEGIKALYEWFTKLTPAEEAAAQRLEEFDQNMIQLEKTLQSMDEKIKAGADISESMQQAAISVLQHSKNVDALRYAYDQLQQSQPGILKNLTDQELLAGGATEQIKKLNEANKLRAELDAKSQGIQAIINQEKANNVKLGDAELELIQKRNAVLGIKGNSKDASEQRGLAQVSEAESQEKVNDIQKTATELAMQRNKLQDEYNASYSKFSELQVKDVPNSAKNKLSPYEFSGQGEKKLADSLYNEKIKDLQNDAQYQKELIDNTNNSLQVRLDANIKYYHILNDIAQEQAEKTITDNKEAAKKAHTDIVNFSKRIHELESEGKGSAAQQEQRAELVKNLRLQIKDRQDLIDASHINEVGAIKQRDLTIAKNAQNGQNAIIEIYQSTDEKLLDNQKEASKKLQINDALQAADEITQLTKQLQSKQITIEQYNKSVEKIQREFREKELKADIEAYNQLLESGKIIDEQVKLNILNSIASSQKELNQIQSGNSGRLAEENHNEKYPTNFIVNAIADSAGLTDLDKRKELQKDFWDNTVTLAKTSMDAIQTIQDNEFAHEQDLLNKQTRNLQLQYSQRIAAINATAGFEIAKKNELAVADAQYNAQTNMIEREQQTLAIKKARFDRQASEEKIIMDTATGVMNVWAHWSDNVPVAVALSALVTGIGVAQLAAAASAPIPTYRYGTDSTTTPTFIAGEAGEQEWIQTPSGKGYWSGTKAKLFNEPIGTSVTPMSKIMEFATNKAGNDLNTIEYSLALSERIERKATQYIFESVGDKIDEMANRVVIALENNKGRNIDVKDAIRMEMNKQNLRGGRL